MIMENKAEQICNEIIKTLKALRKEYDMESIALLVEDYKSTPKGSVVGMQERERKEYK